MGVEIASERRLLSADEYGPVASSHHPALSALPHAELVELAQWLRARRDRARDLIRDRRRARRGKAEGRDPGASERGLAAKKQVFARGLKRVNGRLEALADEARRAEALARLRAAVAGRRDRQVHHPQPGMTASAGMASIGSGRRRNIIQGGRVGSTSQANRVAQARRDAR